MSDPTYYQIDPEDQGRECPGCSDCMDSPEWLLADHRCNSTGRLGRWVECPEKCDQASDHYNGPHPDCTTCNSSGLVPERGPIGVWRRTDMESKYHGEQWYWCEVAEAVAWSVGPYSTEAAALAAAREALSDEQE